MYDIKDREKANRNRLLHLISKIPEGVPDGWGKMEFGVGGLMYLGFSDVHTEKLISISSQGQRIINCKTGEKTYCDENYDEEDLVAFAEELGEEMVSIAGEGGGGLRKYSKDGNILEMVAPFWPKQKVIFMPSWNIWHLNPEKCTIIYDSYELKAFGFSKCGNYIAVGDSADLNIFKKISK